MNIPKKNIYLKAYFRNNLGDDMFVRCIAKRYPNTLFRISTSQNYAKAFKSQLNIKNLSSFQYFMDRVSGKILKKRIFKQRVEKKSHATVHIGGSIFIEPENFIVPKQPDAKSNLYIIGCNFGPYKTRAYRNFVYSKLQNSTDVCFRDRYSYNEFSDIAHTRFAPDVLFGYPGYPVPQKGSGVGISVICLDGRPELRYIADVYYNVIAQTIDCCSQEGRAVKLFSFCSDEGDAKAVEEITKRCNCDNVEICKYDGDIDFMLEKLNSCEYIIASRFHAMIIGWVLSKKVFPIVYSDKQLNVIKDTNFMGPYWDLRDTEIYTSNQLFQNMIHSEVFSHVNELKANSEIQFEKLDEYLIGGKKL